MREWEPVKLSEPLQDGIDAHAIVSGLADAVKLKASRRAISFALRFQEMSRDYQLYDWVEQYQRVQWRGFTLRRIMDAGGKYDDTPVLLDYKSANWPWETNQGVTSKALGFQTTIYLIPPSDPQDLGPFGGGWPTTMDYLVAPEKGANQVFRAERSAADEDNLEQAITLVGEAVKVGRFPKVQGWGCKYCNFFEMCYQTEGWHKKFKRREPRALPVLELAE